MKSSEMRRVRRLAALAQGQKPDGLDCYFEEIAQQFRPYIHAIAFSILGNRDEAEDAVSDALLKGYINLHGFTIEERQSLKAKVWLAEITRNLCIDYQKKEKEVALDGLLEAGYPLAAHLHSDPEKRALYADAVAIISNVVDTLSPREREIIRRFFLADEPGGDVAKSLGISRTTLYGVTILLIPLANCASR